MKLGNVFLAGVAAAALLCGAAWAAEPLKIGLILPMSGPFAGYGKQIEHGVKLYLSQHADTAGGRKVELIVKDDNPGTAGDVDKRLAQELVVKDKVDMLAGFGLTPSALAVAPVATEAKKPMVIMNAATSVITDEVALYRARLHDAAAEFGADGQMGGEERHQESLHRWSPTTAPAMTPRRNSRRPSRRRRRDRRRRSRAGPQSRIRRRSCSGSRTPSRTPSSCSCRRAPAPSPS